MINKLKFSFLLFSLIFSSLSCTRINFNVKQKDIEPPRLQKSEIPTDVFLKFETHLVTPKKTEIISSCSAFSAKHSKTGTIGITNFHCVDTPLFAKILLLNKDIKLIYKVKLPTNQYFEVKVLKRDSITDLASFVIKDVHLNIARIAKREPIIGEEVRIIGTPVGWDTFADRFGTVPIIRGLYNGKMKIDRLGGTVGFLYSARIAPGSSGSPVFVKRNNTYEIIGVIHSGIILYSGNGDSFQEFCAGTSLADLRKFLSDT